MDVNPSSLQTKEIWLVELLLGIIALLLANWGIKRLIKYLRQRSLSSSERRERSDKVLLLPIQLIFWIVGITFALDLISARFGLTSFAKYIPIIRKVGIVACLAWLLLRWKKEFFQIFQAKSLGRRRIDAGMMHALGRVVSIAIVILAALIVLQLIGINVGPLLAFGGIGAAAIGFAAKDVISNFFGGFMLHVTRTFTIGDWIFLPERNTEGSVEEMGWYLTCIRDKEKRPVYIPNAAFAETYVINCSRMSHRRIEETIHIRFEDFAKIKPLVEELKKVLSSHSRVDAHLPIIVYFSHVDTYSLDISIDIYTLETRYDQFLILKQEILLLVHGTVSAQGAEIPYPTEVIVSR